MNRSLLLFVPLLAACGSVVIVPGDPRADAAAPDAAVLDGNGPGDAVTPPPPPPPDVTVVDATPPPPPPPPPPQTLARACQTFCMRGNAVCRTTADCATLCRNALTQSGVTQCPAEALALITCGTNRNGFVCRPGSNSFDLDRMLCAAESMAFDRCQATPPPPPPPPPMDPLREVCARVCDRQARDCGTASSGCVEQCASVASAPNYDRCSAQVLTVYACAARERFTCGPMGMNQLPAACRPAAQAAQSCLNGPTDPPPPPDDGGVAPLYRACVDACAVADRACGTSDPSCAADCSSTAAMLSGACLRTFDELMTCVQRNGFTCMGGSPQPSSLCNSPLMRLEMCAGGGGGGGAPPPTVDAGRPDV